MFFFGDWFSPISNNRCLRSVERAFLFLTENYILESLCSFSIFFKYDFEYYDKFVSILKSYHPFIFSSSEYSPMLEKELFLILFSQKVKFKICMIKSAKKGLITQLDNIISSSQILLSRPDSINSPEDFNINNIINFPMNFLNLLSNPSSGTPLPTQPSTSISPTPNSSHNPNSPTPSTPPPSARSPKTNPPPPPTSSSLPTVPPSIKSYPLPNPDGIKIKTDQSISSTQHPDAPERNPSARKTPWTCYRQRTRSDIEGRGRGKTRDRIKQKEDVKMP